MKLRDGGAMVVAIIVFTLIGSVAIDHRTNDGKVTNHIAKSVDKAMCKVARCD